MVKNLLIIEKNPVAMMIVTFIVELYNPQRFEVTYRKLLDEGLEAAASSQPDLILLELEEYAYENITTLSKFAPVIVVSNHLLAEPCEKAGASGFIRKDTLTLEHKDEVIAIVKCVLDARPGCL